MKTYLSHDWIPEFVHVIFSLTEWIVVVYVNDCLADCSSIYSERNIDPKVLYFFHLFGEQGV